MKRIIEIPDKVVEAIQNGEDYRYDIHTAIAQSTPYNPSGDAISRDALKKTICLDEIIGVDETWEQLYDAVVKAIDNAPPVELEKEIIPVCNVTFDKEQLQEIVDKAVADLTVDCQNCGYLKLVGRFVDGIVEIMNEYGIESVEELKGKLGLEDSNNDRV